MRLVPNSIASRTALLLVAGLLLTLLASVAVFWVDALNGTGPRHYRMFLGRIAMAAAAIDRAPPHIRPEMAAALAFPALDLSWRPGANAQHAAADDWTSRHIQRDVAYMSRRELADVAVGAAGASGADESRRIAIRLSDGSWLEVSSSLEFVTRSWFARFALAILVFVGGISAIAVWAARKLTRPLKAFAAAATRLGNDVNSPPLPVTGPSEIRQAASAFNAMQQRIQRFVEDRTLMLGAISHDLRTGLTRLRLRTEYIKDDEQRLKAQADLDEMQSMLNATLAFSRDETEPEPRTKVDLASLLQTLCDEFVDAEQRASYEGPNRLSYECYPISLRRALRNLIENAIAYGGEALVRLSERAQEVEIAIGDRGPGIAAPLREKVFLPFFRVETSRSRDTGGVGLGLAIARSIVRRHGGDIALADREGGGLWVKIVLPRASA